MSISKGFGLPTGVGRRKAGSDSADYYEDSCLDGIGAKIVQILIGP